MKALTAPQLLRIWERGVERHPIDRVLTILAESEPEVSFDDLSALPIGWRDRRLLAIREATFGSEFRALLSCPSCGERLEFALAASDLRREVRQDQSAAPTRLEVGEFALEIRLPDSIDLAAVRDCSDVDSARCLLAQRCVVSARRGDQQIASDCVPDSVVPDIAKHLEDVEAGDDTTLALTCPACEVHSEALFDIGTFLWAEIEAEALHLFRDVHHLARGYGWDEADLLAMTPVRRRVYLELLQA